MNKKILLILILLFITTGCTKRDNELNVLNWSSYIPDSIINDFEKETGIKVNYGSYSSNEELLAKISTSKSETYDLIFPSDYMVELMIKRNLIDKIDKNKIPNIKNLNKNYMNLEYDKNNNYSLPFLLASTVIIKNKAVIKDEINSYKDLLNIHYKDELIMLDDQRIVIGLGLLALGYDMNSTNINELNEAREFILKIKENIKLFDSDSPKNYLISKEVNLGVIWNAEAALVIKNNPNMEVIFPDDGFAISIDNFCIVKNAKNKENAYKFINYILRGDIMAKIISEYPYKNVNKEAEKYLDEEYLQNKAANIPDDIIKKGIFVKNIDEKIKLYDKTWASIK